MTAKQQRAIEALLSEPSIRQAATVAGLGEKTIRRWLQNAEFSQAYQQARQHVFADALAGLRAATHDAVNALRTAIREETGALRLRAATAVLELSIRSAETLEVEARLERLERMLDSPLESDHEGEHS
jgi:hypothetical protein